MPYRNETLLTFSAAERNQATLRLCATTLLWGLSFPLLKQWEQVGQSVPAWEALNQPTRAGVALGPLLSASTVIAVRMYLALLALAVVEPGVYTRSTRREHGVGVTIGSLFWLGSTLQVVGLAWTTPAVSAFITSLGSAWVPLLAYFWFRQSMSLLMVAGFGLGLSGTFVLAGFHGGFDWGAALTLIASLLFAWEIMLLDQWGRRHRSAHFTPGLLGVCGVAATFTIASAAMFGPGVDAYCQWLVQVLALPLAWLTIGLLTLFCTVLPFHWMNVYQPRMEPTRAALIYLAEPPFATLFSVLWGMETLTMTLIFGGVLILGGNVLVEGPRWWRLRKPFATG